MKLGNIAGNTTGPADEFGDDYEGLDGDDTFEGDGQIAYCDVCEKRVNTPIRRRLAKNWYGDDDGPSRSYSRQPRQVRIEAGEVLDMCRECHDYVESAGVVFVRDPNAGQGRVGIRIG